ncbi:MAG: CPBP family intramembrane metalloprotease [Bacteroidia bacterium]|nr:MAG: CPBP family intramembrane metalloprotease [Bacteroidia bacterium]
MVTQSLTPELIRALAALLCITVGYAAYYFIAFSDRAGRFFKKHHAPVQNEISLFLFQKLTGFFFLGLLPGVIYLQLFPFYPERYSFAGIQPPVPVYVVVLLALLIVITAAFSAKKHDIYRRIPHMRIHHWGIKEIAISIGGWAMYLLAYEFIFRGLLLFSTAEAWGLWPAVLINLFFYAVFHIPNGRKETLAAIPFGLVLCAVSLLSGSFWLAFLLHLVLSVSTEMFAIHFNPDMQFHFRGALEAERARERGGEGENERGGESKK